MIKHESIIHSVTKMTHRHGVHIVSILGRDIPVLI